MVLNVHDEVVSDIPNTEEYDMAEIVQDSYLGMDSDFWRLEESKGNDWVLQATDLWHFIGSLLQTGPGRCQVRIICQCLINKLIQNRSLKAASEKTQHDKETPCQQTALYE